MKEKRIETVIEKFIKAANAFDVTSALALFAADAVIDDVSVGEKFKHTAGCVLTWKNFSWVIIR